MKSERIIKTYESYNLEEIDLGKFSDRINKDLLTLNEDGSYDYKGDLFFSNMLMKSLTELSIKIRSVFGDFNCYGNNLISLEGSPENVFGNVYCSRNCLISLQYLPKQVDGNVYCRDNQLLSQKHSSNVKGGIKFSHDFNAFQYQVYIEQTIKKMTHEQIKKELEFFDENDPEASVEFQKILIGMGLGDVDYMSNRKQMKELVKGNSNYGMLGL